MSKQYLILIEQLVREGRSEREIERIVDRVVSEDEQVAETGGDEPAELDRAA